MVQVLYHVLCYEKIHSVKAPECGSVNGAQFFCSLSLKLYTRFNFSTWHRTLWAHNFVVVIVYSPSLYMTSLCFVFFVCVLFLSTASPHTFNNSRTSYSHQTDYRQERTEERGDVSTWPLNMLSVINMLFAQRHTETDCRDRFTGVFVCVIEIQKLIVLFVSRVVSPCLSSSCPSWSWF